MNRKLSPCEYQLLIIKKVSDFMGLDPAIYEAVSRHKARAPETLALALTRTKFFPSRTQVLIAFS